MDRIERRRSTRRLAKFDGHPRLPAARTTALTDVAVPTSLAEPLLRPPAPPPRRPCSRSPPRLPLVATPAAATPDTVALSSVVPHLQPASSQSNRSSPQPAPFVSTSNPPVARDLAIRVPTRLTICRHDDSTRDPPLRLTTPPPTPRAPPESDATVLSPSCRRLLAAVAGPP
ncbi:vegetative cell wall protein gp1-like [Eucalyptus grandis]|uniref:vegetative cell wall protein gp1-like n=1 Tax=Eucalyptus grandis TaxID=71139 RepID=UPI00192E88A6|nr:vegetative cell wall protein gp1-like [Eucalyptus grandis]